MTARAGVPTMLAGLVLIGAAKVVAPSGGPPLYDGVVPAEPYRYVAPAAGQIDSPFSYTNTQSIEDGASPAFSAATGENPPQAQLIAPVGAFQLTPGATTLTIFITPIPAAGVPTDQVIAGNLYRVRVTDQNGIALSLSAGNQATLILRAPDTGDGNTVARVAGNAWQRQPTQPSSQPGLFVANVSELGDFALVGAASGLPLPVILLIALAVTIVVGVIGWSLLRARFAPAPASARVSTRRPVPAGPRPSQRNKRRKRKASP